MLYFTSRFYKKISKMYSVEIIQETANDLTKGYELTNTQILTLKSELYNTDPESLEIYHILIHLNELVKDKSSSISMKVIEKYYNSKYVTLKRSLEVKTALAN